MLHEWHTVAETRDYALLNAIGHIDHCIDTLRQSTQCASDLSPYVWQWDEEKNKLSDYPGNLHTCRNFEDVSISPFPPGRGSPLISRR